MILIDRMLRKRKIKYEKEIFVRIPKTSERCGNCYMFCSLCDNLCTEINRNSKASYIPNDFYVSNLGKVWVC